MLNIPTNVVKSVSNPGPADVHTIQDLGQFANGWWAGNDGVMGATEAASDIPVDKEFFNFPEFLREDLFRDDVGELARGAESPTTDWRLSREPTQVRFWAIAKDIDARDEANQDAWVRLNQSTVAALTIKQRIHSEKMAAFAISGTDEHTGTQTNPWTNTMAVTNRWDNQMDGTPYSDIITAKRTVTNGTNAVGPMFKPNALFIPPEAEDALMNNDQVAQMLETDSSELVSKLTDRQALARALKVDYLYVGDMVETSSNKKVITSTSADPTYKNVNPTKNGYLFYKAPRVVWGIPTGFARFMYQVPGLTTGMARGQNSTMMVRRIPHPLAHGYRVELILSYVDKVLAPDTGIQLTNIVTP